jgi:hypothetical protein
MAIYLGPGAQLPEDAIGKLVIYFEYNKVIPRTGLIAIMRKVMLTRNYITHADAVKLAKDMRAANPDFINLTANWTMEHVNIF